VASFLPHGVYSVLAILFSLCQGDPLAALLFVIHLKSFLAWFEAVLAVLCAANIGEASFGYIDDVQVLGDDLQDIVRVELACRGFEVESGALLNRNHKMTIVGLGSWTRTGLSSGSWPPPL
jgi:hypothetical protein